MDLAYVEMIESASSGMAPSAMVRLELDPLLRMTVPPGVSAPVVDREAWLRGEDAVVGQEAMLSLAKGMR